MPTAWWGDPGDTGGDPAFITKPSAWDVMYVGSGAGRVRIPGLVRVKPVKKHKVDDKNVPGNDGSTPTFLGYSSAQIDVYVRIWTKAQFMAFEALLPSLSPFKSGPPPPIGAPPKLPPGSRAPDGSYQAPTAAQWALYDQQLATYNASLNKPRAAGKKTLQPIDVEHPALQMLRIKSMYVLDVTPFEPEKETDPDNRIAILKCKEFSKSKASQMTTPTGSASSISSQPTAIQLQTPVNSAPNTDPSLTESGPLPSGGATGSF